MLTFRPKAYEPEHGYCAQLFYRYNTREWEHLDYAVDRTDLAAMLADYRLAMSNGEEITFYPLPKRFHKI